MPIDVQVIHQRPTVIELIWEGQLTQQDYKNLIPLLETFVSENDRVNVLVRLNEFQGWTPAALWEDLKFDYHYFGNVEKLALVGDHRWQEYLTKMTDWFTSVQTRFFNHEDAENALNWLTESETTQTTVKTKGA